MDEDISQEMLDELKTKTDLPIFLTVAELNEGTPEMIESLRLLIMEEREKAKAASEAKMKEAEAKIESLEASLASKASEFTVLSNKHKAAEENFVLKKLLVASCPACRERLSVSQRLDPTASNKNKTTLTI